MRRRGWWICGVLVLLTNLIVLAGVARNRSGEPEAVIVLTERELTLVHPRNEDTGVSLRLQSGGSLDPDWLGRTQLEDLGFDCSAPPNAREATLHYSKQLPRQGYVVLEFDGDAWQQWLAQQRMEFEEAERKIERGELKSTVERQRQNHEWYRGVHTRLFYVDAGRDPRALRARYSERDRFLILPAVFGIRKDPGGRDETGQKKPARLRGFVSQLLVQNLHVPRSLARQLEPFDRRDGWTRPAYDPSWSESGDETYHYEPRYTVTLSVGHRYEPWIERIALID